MRKMTITWTAPAAGKCTCCGFRSVLRSPRGSLLSAEQESNRLCHSCQALFEAVARGESLAGPLWRDGL
jgi:hypothetical protein